jgi:hypothetical protein
MAIKNMKITRSLIFLAAAVPTLAGCATSDPSSGGLLGRFADPLNRLTVPATNDVEITYSNNDIFDFALNGSMKGSTPVITIPLPATSTDPMMFTELRNASPANSGDERMNRWLLAISNSNGSIFACENTPPESGLWALVGLLVDIFMPAINDYVTYRPARNYHAVVSYNPDTDIVTQVKMLNRSTVDAGTLTCEQASHL